MNSTDGSSLRKSPRLAGFDYATPGGYFITICTQDMELRFGAVEGGVLVPNEAGRMVASQWQANTERVPGAAVDALVVMPNHIHAILFLGTDPSVIGTGTSLIRIVQSFKSLTTVEYARGVHARRYDAFAGSLWQRSFHDRILRGERALENARHYIEDNPRRWAARSRGEEGV